MNRPLLTVTLGLVLLALVVLLRRPSTAQEEEPAQQTQLVAAVDITPLRQELTAMRAELAALRAAVADEKGLRGDLSRAADAVGAMAKEVTALAELFAQYAKTTEPVIQALEPPQRWEYRVLHTRSDRVANRLGMEGWEMVVGSQDWLFFKRPLRGTPRGAAPEEKE